MSVGDFLTWWFFPRRAMVKLFGIQKYYTIVNGVGALLALGYETTYCVKSVQGDAFYDRSNSAMGKVLTHSGSRAWDWFSMFLIIPFLANLASVGVGVYFAIGIEIADIDLDYFAHAEFPRLMASTMLFANSFVVNPY